MLLLECNVAQWEEKHTDLRRLSSYASSYTCHCGWVTYPNDDLCPILLSLVVRIKRNNKCKSGLKHTIHFQI